MEVLTGRSYKHATAYKAESTVGNQGHAACYPEKRTILKVFKTSVWNFSREKEKRESYTRLL